MTGLTDRQAVLLELSGMLELVTWKVTTAKVAFTTAEPADKAAAEYLRKVERGLENLRKWATENGWRPDAAAEKSLRGRNTGDAP